MNAHRCEVIPMTNARKITACNSVFAPVSHDAELAEAAPFWTDENAPLVETRTEAPQWQWRDENGRIIRKADALPAIKPQAEINAEAPVFSPAAYVVMFSAVAAVVAIITAFDWLVGVP